MTKLPKRVSKASRKRRSRTSAKALKKAVGKRRGPKVGSKRIVYSVSLRRQVVKAIRKGMKHLEASKKFKVGRHSIPGWLKKY